MKALEGTLKGLSPERSCSPVDSSSLRVALVGGGALVLVLAQAGVRVRGVARQAGAGVAGTSHWGTIQKSHHTFKIKKFESIKLDMTEYVIWFKDSP